MNLKKSERAQSELILAEALATVRRLEAELMALYDKKEHIFIELDDIVVHHFDTKTIAPYNHYLRYLDMEIVKKNKQIMQAEHDVIEKRQQLVDKTLEQKVWVTSRDKALQKFQHEYMLEEQKVLDEIGLTRYIKDEQ